MENYRTKKTKINHVTASVSSDNPRSHLGFFLKQPSTRQADLKFFILLSGFDLMSFHWLWPTNGTCRVRGCYTMRPKWLNTWQNQHRRRNQCWGTYVPFTWCYWVVVVQKPRWSREYACCLMPLPPRFPSESQQRKTGKRALDLSLRTVEFYQRSNQLFHSIELGSSVWHTTYLLNKWSHSLQLTAGDVVSSHAVKIVILTKYRPFASV